MTFQLVIVDEGQRISQIRELFWEYLLWANERVKEEFQISFEISEIIEDDMINLAKFMPTYGCLVLGYAQDHPAGIACLKKLANNIGEIKRMYVRPESRKHGLG